MQRFGLVGVALMAIFALGAFASTAAFAELPLIVPEPTKASPATFEATGGVSKLESIAGSVIECKTLAESNGEFTSGDAGKTALNFEGCKSSGVGCNTSGDTKEKLLFPENTINLVDPKAGTLGTLITLTKTLVSKCGVSLTIEVKGAVLGSIAGVKSGQKVKAFTASFKQSALGVQELKTCISLKATCEGREFELEVNFGRRSELAALTAEAKVKCLKPTEVAIDF